MRAGRLHTASSHSDDSSLLSHTRHHPHPHPNRRYHPPPRGASFLLSFEPLVDKYALLLAKGTKRFVGSKKDIAVPLGRHHKRGVVLPFAVSPAGGDINFTVSAVSGCSSMAQIHPQSRYKNILRTWGLKCDEAFEKRIQP